MRKDMKDLLLESGRSGGYGKAASRRFRFKNADDEQLPRFISSARHRQPGNKELGDRLRPLHQFLKANCGRPWDDVYRDICAFADSRSIRGYHLRQHVWQYVIPNNYDVGHTGRYGPFFVDPDGTLQEQRVLTEAERQANYRLNAKRYLWKSEPKKIPNPRIVKDADRWWEKIEGFWFAFETKHYTRKNSYEDLVEENGVIKIVRIQLRDTTHHITSKRQVNGKIQKELDKKYGQSKRR